MAGSEGETTRNPFYLEESEDGAQEADIIDMSQRFRAAELSTASDLHPDPELRLAQAELFLDGKENNAHYLAARRAVEDAFGKPDK